MIYRLGGVREEVEQHWTHYAGAVLAISIAKFAFTYLIQRLQGFLPLNPQGFSTASAATGATPMTPDLAFNTAVSFMTNTNWQSYVGETTMSYFVQMTALTVQNFTSAAAGIAIAIALVRGFARHEMKTIGNFWVDFTRATVYVLLPLAFVAALIFASQGVVQNWDAYTQATTVEGATQTIAQGPVASQEAIKQLGTNGGGFFNANSAHPFENPTPLSTTLQILLIFMIPAGLTYTFGTMVKDTRQGWSLFAAMSVMFLIGVFVGVLVRAARESDPGAARDRVGRDRDAAGRQHGRQGGPVRHRPVGAVCHGDDRRQLRGGQRDARQLHAARRARARSSTFKPARSSSAASARGSTASCSTRFSPCSSPA